MLQFYVLISGTEIAWHVGLESFPDAKQLPAVITIYLVYNSCPHSTWNLTSALFPTGLGNQPQSILVIGSTMQYFTVYNMLEAKTSIHCFSAIQCKYKQNDMPLF